MNYEVDQFVNNKNFQMPNLNQYYTYKDEYRKDISKDETLFKIRFLLSKYSKKTVLGMLSFVGKRMNIENPKTNIPKVQEELFGHSFEKLFIVHSRAVLVLYQLFCDVTQFNDSDTSEIINPDDACVLFLLTNHLLDKCEYKSIKNSDKIVPIELLMFMMRMSTDLIGPNDVRLQANLFIRMYEKCTEHEDFLSFDRLLKSITGLEISDFIVILKSFVNQEHVDHLALFEKLGNCLVLDFEEVNEVWNSRKPVINIPFDYRFPEQYPLIKSEGNYFLINFTLLIKSIILKPYHILSASTEEWPTNFRTFFSKEIAEPVMRDILRETFLCSEIIEVQTYRKGNEYADFGIVEGDKIFLFEIKSAYMGLEKRYSQDSEEFKSEFDKRYILNSSGKHQQIGQLINIEENFDNFLELASLERKRYKIFSIIVVFDEVLKGFEINPFDLYVRNIFNQEISERMSEFTNILPFTSNVMITYNELMFLKESIKDPLKRLQIILNFFTYDKSNLETLILSLINGSSIINGITQEDFLK